jgi:lysosomal Pro-X carboxypeptidase
MFGGQMDVPRDYLHYSNIVFANGNLDPWSTGGIDCGLPESSCGQENFISWKLPVYIVRDGAHHLELRPVNEADPTDANYVRSQYKDLVNQWSADFLGRPELKRDIAWAPGIEEATI